MSTYAYQTGRPNISVRKCISWANGFRTEPTSTLVLSSRLQRFVDVRIKANVAPLNRDGLPHPSVYPPVVGQDSLFPQLTEDKVRGDMLHSEVFDGLDWAFAGLAVHTPPTTDINGRFTPLHTRFHHELDSRCAERESVRGFIDEGDMWPDPNFPRLELERGHMPHPETGMLTPYDELWHGLAPKGTGAVPGQPICVVLERRSVNDDLDGLIIRVGQFVQGILRLGQRMKVQRWMWLPHADRAQGHLEQGIPPDDHHSHRVAHGSWHCTVDLGPRSKEFNLPCWVTWNEEFETTLTAADAESTFQTISHNLYEDHWRCVEAGPF